MVSVKSASIGRMNVSESTCPQITVRATSIFPVRPYVGAALMPCPMRMVDAVVSGRYGVRGFLGGMPIELYCRTRKDAGHGRIS